MLQAKTVDCVPSDSSITDLITEKIHSKTEQREDMEDPFYMVDLSRVLELHRNWYSTLPSIHPFYAVKCNDDPLLLKTLAAVGTGFDCASKGEMKTILDLGVAPDRIIYANPCKQTSHLKFAARHGIKLMTFDNEIELQKVKVHCPGANLVLRIRADDPTAVCQLGVKFGCSVNDAKRLLTKAQSLKLQVVGVSFHVGSGCQTPSAYNVAIEMAAEVFEHADSVGGYHFTLLDIGGGFPGALDSMQLFEKLANAINKSIEHHFSSRPDLQVIAEPGRYFACSTHTLAVNVISKRVVEEEDAKAKSFMYYVNDGVYGSFNCILFDHVTPSVAVLQPGQLEEVHPSSVWGPTCDGLDRICDAALPEVGLGDWLFFTEMGAYTVSAASSFNGFLKPKAYYYIRDSYRVDFQQLFGFEEAVVDERGDCKCQVIRSCSSSLPPFIFPIFHSISTCSHC